MINIDSRLLNEVDPDELFLLCRLVNRINKGRTCFPSNSTLQVECNWSRDKLQRVKRRLISKGMIQVKKQKSDAGDWKSSLYTIVTPLVKNMVGGSTTDSTTLVLPVTLGSGTEQAIEVLKTEVLKTEVLKSDSDSEQGPDIHSFDSLKQKFNGKLWAFIDSLNLDEIELYNFDTEYSDDKLRGAAEKFSIDQIAVLLVEYIDSKWDEEEREYTHSIDYFLDNVEHYDVRFREGNKDQAQTLLVDLNRVYNTRRKMHDPKLRETALPVDKKTFASMMEAIRYFQDKGGVEAIRNAFVSFIDDEIKEKRYRAKKPLNYFFHKNEETESFEIIREHLSDYNTNYSV